MKVIVSKKLEKMEHVHLRFEGYLDLIKRVSEIYEGEAKSSYLKARVDINGIPENRDFSKKTIAEIESDLAQGKIVEIESAIPASFIAGNKLWYTVGEGPIIETYRKISLVCEALDTEEVRNLRNNIERLPEDYSVDIEGREFFGKDTN